MRTIWLPRKMLRISFVIYAILLPSCIGYIAQRLLFEKQKQKVSNEEACKPKRRPDFGLERFFMRKPTFCFQPGCFSSFIKSSLRFLEISLEIYF